MFATNAGIFEPDGSPTGLYVEEGVELKPLNLTEGKGNFYLQPNGVFAVTDQERPIVTSSAKWKERRMSRIRYATQSGPMLVTDNKINEQFNAQSESHKTRSGVGIDNDGNIIFALSVDRVTFYRFAKLFRDDLHCSNALYLDGEISRFHLSGDPVPPGQSFAAMIAVYTSAVH